MFLRRLHFNLPPPWNSSGPCLSVPPHSDRSIYLRRKLASISSLSITERLFIVFALGVQLASSHFFPRPLRVTPTKTPKHSHCRYKSKRINWKLKFASVPHKSKKQTEKTSTFHSIVHFSFACLFAFYFLFPFPFVSINLSFICIFPSLFFLPFLFFIICSLCLAFPLWLFHKHTNTHSLAHLSGAYGHFGWSVVQRSSTSLVFDRRHFVTGPRNAQIMFCVPFRFRSSSILSSLSPASASPSSSSSSGRRILSALIILTGYCQLIEAVCNEQHWWQPQLNKCIPCTVCDASQSIVLRPCQLHSDTVCGTLDDIEFDLNILRAAAAVVEEERVSVLLLVIFKLLWKALESSQTDFCWAILVRACVWVPVWKTRDKFPETSRLIFRLARRIFDYFDRLERAVA